MASKLSVLQALEREYEQVMGRLDLARAALDSVNSAVAAEAPLPPDLTGRIGNCLTDAELKAAAGGSAARRMALVSRRAAWKALHGDARLRHGSQAEEDAFDEAVEAMWIARRKLFPDGAVSSV